MKDLVSIIIVNYNGMKFLKRCLLSVFRQSYPEIEVILVDNGSTDGSVNYIKKEFPSVKIIENGKNFGFARANNIGIKDAKGDFIATLNNDTEVAPEWIEQLVNVINSDKRVGMCASKMLFDYDPNLINSIGIYISRSGACWDRGIFEIDNGQYEIIEETFGPCAGAALYKREMLEETGLFDEDFYAYMEDVDLAFRGRLAGWKCLYVPKAIVYHVHSGTTGFETDFKVYYSVRNIVWNCVKNFPIGIFITCLPWMIGRNIAMVPFYTLRRHGRAALRSEIDAIKGIPRMINKRTKCKVDEKEIKKYIRNWTDIASPPKILSENKNQRN